MTTRSPNSFRRYGSIRILRDGRVRYSPWTFPILRYLSFLCLGDIIDVEISGKQVLYLYLSQGRMQSACFPYYLTPDELRGTIDDLRAAGHGLERWIVPGLEWTSLSSTLRENNPATYAIIPELLESCRDLPVADQWKRVRANVFANAARAQAKRARSKKRGAERE